MQYVTSNDTIWNNSDSVKEIERIQNEIMEVIKKSSYFTTQADIDYFAPILISRIIKETKIKARLIDLSDYKFDRLNNIKNIRNQKETNMKIELEKQQIRLGCMNATIDLLARSNILRGGLSESDLEYLLHKVEDYVVNGNRFDTSSILE